MASGKPEADIAKGGFFPGHYEGLKQPSEFIHLVLLRNKKFSLLFPIKIHLDLLF